MSLPVLRPFWIREGNLMHRYNGRADGPGRLDTLLVDASRDGAHHKRASGMVKTCGPKRTLSTGSP